ncbi:MAG: VOC family protein [Acetobacteraceae bacterium]
MAATGLHHVTLITRRAQANVDFYAGFLGLRLVKRTGGFEDPGQLHLFYGDAAGSPGSLVTFLVWEDGASGRTGIGQASELGLAIDPKGLGFWLTRCLTFGVPHRMAAPEFGERCLRIADPDGIVIKLVGATDLPAMAPWHTPDVPPEHAVRRLRGATILSDAPGNTAAFLARYFGFRSLAIEGNTERLISDAADVIDVGDGSGFWRGAPGTGTINHIALRAPDAAALSAVSAALKASDAEVSELKDRRYFSSIYVREPAGALIELATDGPGMTIDEKLESLGTRLFVPPNDIERAEDIRVILPRIARPGEERDMHPELPFVHHLYRPEDADGSTLVLLHGTGGNETDLLPLGRRIAPSAALLGVRGRSTEEGQLRWFRRLTATTFDQVDVRAEAEAFAEFLPEAFRSYRLDPARATFVGYSNGANFIAAFMLLNPDLVRRAALLRAMLVLDDPPAADLAGSSALMVTGRSDPYSRYAPALNDTLRKRGARVDARSVPAGHQLIEEDIAILQGWIAGLHLEGRLENASRPNNQ